MTTFKKYFEDNQKNIEEHQKRVAVVKKLHPSNDVIAWVIEDKKSKEDRIIVEYHPMVHGDVSRIHRLDGPACLVYTMDGNLIEKKYYLLGKEIKEKDFQDEDFVELFLIQHG